ncbi:RTA1 like protein-domain-containing protein [Emericellopsis atlantica]|uniref:RTA1 like protein-domain-containing protein n=1 Tax=Emericellopsis atlantica TaxID=2614577 RepID=A0A9P7ZHP3_9HYPO|nr:RTA1 like protein-domain-containing protein [Emericellopsis atlantica]KAG9251916.1 RTA1 like protein-domain-containing protein [Emericellopsis atlantica]
MSFDSCTELSPQCPVEATVLGYRPNLGSSYFFAIAFGICTIAAASLGDSGAFQLQICAIILAPSLICVSIYLTLKHVALTVNPALSRIPPTWYPRIFLPADLSCLIVQAIGGGLAAAAGKNDKKLLDSGNNMIIAGIVLQVVVLLVFGVLGFDYWLRAKKHMRHDNPAPESLAVWNDGKFRMFGIAVMGAFIVIFVRCIYRFLVLDPTMIFIATYLLTIFHPGIFFPQMRNGHGKSKTATGEAAAAADESREKPAESSMGESGNDTPRATAV